MKWIRLVLVVAVLPSLAVPSSAGIFFNRKSRQQNQGDKVQALIQTARSDRSERRREAAVEELREYDPNMYPEIIPLLIEKVQNDPSSDVRQEAAASLGKLRVATPQANMALQQAQSNDSSRSVRKEAKKWLANIKNQIMPNEQGNGQGNPVVTTEEPPLAGPHDPVIVRQPPRTVNSVPTSRPVVRPSGPVTGPELPAPNAGPTLPRPLPKGPTQPPLVPSSTPDLVKPPALPSSEGPEVQPPF